MKFAHIFLLFFSLILLKAGAQTYHSSLTEYKYGNHQLSSPYKWKETSITIANDTITIISHQQHKMEAQRWAINNEEVVYRKDSEIHQYFTHLINTPGKRLLPAKLSVNKTSRGKVEFIDLEFPPSFNNKEAPHVTARFHVNYTY